MDENPGLSEQYRRASVWPLFVALGIPISEIGILFGIPALSVGGLLLFCGSVSAMINEAGYTETPWNALMACAILLFIGGAGILYADAHVSLKAAHLARRGWAIIGTGGVLLIGGLLGRLFVRGPEDF